MTGRTCSSRTSLTVKWDNTVRFLKNTSILLTFKDRQRKNKIDQKKRFCERLFMIRLPLTLMFSDVHIFSWYDDKTTFFFPQDFFLGPISLSFSKKKILVAIRKKKSWYQKTFCGKVDPCMYMAQRNQWDYPKQLRVRWFSSSIKYVTEKPSLLCTVWKGLLHQQNHLLK